MLPAAIFSMNSWLIFFWKQLINSLTGEKNNAFLNLQTKNAHQYSFLSLSIFYTEQPRSKISDNNKKFVKILTTVHFMKSTDKDNRTNWIPWVSRQNIQIIENPSHFVAIVCLLSIRIWKYSVEILNEDCRHICQRKTKLVKWFPGESSNFKELLPCIAQLPRYLFYHPNFSNSCHFKFPE